VLHVRVNSSHTSSAEGGGGRACTAGPAAAVAAATPLREAPPATNITVTRTHTSSTKHPEQLQTTTQSNSRQRRQRRLGKSVATHQPRQRPAPGESPGGWGPPGLRRPPPAAASSPAAACSRHPGPWGAWRTPGRVRVRVRGLVAPRGPPPRPPACPGLPQAPPPRGLGCPPQPCPPHCRCSCCWRGRHWGLWCLGPGRWCYHWPAPAPLGSRDRW
jgi:hypothetical protein